MNAVRKAALYIEAAEVATEKIVSVEMAGKVVEVGG